jgi:ADP-ribosylglycohydrolase
MPYGGDMLGAIAGDIAGSRFEGWGRAIKTTEFDLYTEECVFTDDTVLTVAVAEAILQGVPYFEKIREFALAYSRAGFSSMFLDWVRAGDTSPRMSYGNGSAMRASPVGWAFHDLDTVLAEAEKSARPSHAHPEGIRGAQGLAGSVFLARTGTGKEGVREFLESALGYDLSAGLDDIRPGYGFDATCPGSLPQAITAFLEAVNFEDALRNAISLGGDSDTQACMAGAVAEAHFGGVPDHPPQRIASVTLSRLDDRLAGVVRQFQRRYMTPLA